MSFTDLSAGIMWSAALLALWAALTASRGLNIPGRRSFIYMQVAIALWSATAGIELLTRSPLALWWLARVQYFGITSLPVFWFRFAGTYTHRINPRSRHLGGLWLVPIVTMIAVFTNESHHWLWTNVIMPGPQDALPTYVRGPLFWVNWTYA